MECISISHKTASSAERQKCYISKEKAEELLEKLRRGAIEKDTDAPGGMEGGGKQAQCVLLSTCNRTEIYAQNAFEIYVQDAFGWWEEMADLVGEEVEWIRRLARRYQGRRAIRHLFQVTCGMESMVIGEDEILGQVRDAYMRSQKAGCTGYEMNTIFQAALSCAKRVKTQTMLSKTSVSVATLAASEVFRFLAMKKEKNKADSGTRMEAREQQEPIANTVLVIGSTGQMGSLICKDLLSREGIRILATARSHQGMLQSGNPRIKNVDYQDRYAYFEEADVILSATSSPHITVTAGQAAAAMKTVKDRLFVDIAMPPDMDEAVGNMEHCRLVTLDDIKQVAQENNRRKQRSLADAKEILEEELEKVCKVLCFHGFTQKNPHWQEVYGACTAEKLLYLLRDELDSASFEAVLGVLEEESLSREAFLSERADAYKDRNGNGRTQGAVHEGLS